jgi:hypothetical protein
MGSRYPSARSRPPPAPNGRVKLIVTVTRTGTGTPFRRVGRELPLPRGVKRGLLEPRDRAHDLRVCDFPSVQSSLRSQ